MDEALSIAEKTMTKATKPPVFGPNLLDVRVRERFLASGQLDPKALEKYLGELPDSAERYENLGLEQPALSGEGDEPESE